MRTKNWKALAIVLVTVLLLGVTVGGTVAWLAAATDPVENVFTPGDVTPSVSEEISETEKTSIKVSNTGTVPAFVRVAIVANWYNAEGNIVGPYEGEIDIDEGWFEKDGFYYCIDPVRAGGISANMLRTPIGQGEKPTANAVRLEMVVMTQSIQTEPTSVVTTEWGVQVADGKLVAPASTN